jgi:uncharacterized repeat protein (TIGR03803 family)
MAALTTGKPAAAQTEKILHSFGEGADGFYPRAALISDGLGNLYSTTLGGGAYGAGTVFELIPKSGGWSEKILHSFGTNDKDGQGSLSGLIFDARGNLYGTTAAGGAYGMGTVFELSRMCGGWQEKILYSFKSNGNDGNNPYAGLLVDASGNLYGTTQLGGAYDSGTVFELTPNSGGWSEKILHTFGNGIDGQNPYDALIFDGAGNLYGTTLAGGRYNWGTVFELEPKPDGWAEKILYYFTGTNGGYSYAGLVFDTAGNLYGTTGVGGSFGGGTAFELTHESTGWIEKTLHNFNSDGQPLDGLILDAAGNIYGTTVNGGPFQGGSVFELAPTERGTWTETILYNFNGTDGGAPSAPLISDTSGNLYGTTIYGGAYANCGDGFCGGTVFEIKH